MTRDIDAMYLYVDGESHFRRLEALWQEMHPGSSLERVALVERKVQPRAELLYPPTPPRRLTYHRPAAFFWDNHFAYPHGRWVKRAVYFTSCSGDDAALHAARVAIRGAGFEPEVARETTQLANQREHHREQKSLIEKGKGVDIGLAVRMLEDAYLDNFDACCLYSSDIDFLPVIKAVRRMGKIVHLFGFRNGFRQFSELEYVPDFYEDLAEIVRRDYAMVGS